MKTVYKVICVITLCVSIFLPGVGAWAAETQDGGMVITYEEAYEMALANLADISLIDNDVKQTEAQKQVLQKQINDINAYITRENRNTKEYRELVNTLEDDIDLMDNRVEDTFYGNSDDPYGETETLISQRSAMQDRLDQINALIDSKDDSKFSKDALADNIEILNKQIELLTLNQEVIKTNVALSLRNALVKIADYDLDIEATEAGILISEEEVRRTGLKNQLGQASGNDLRNAEYALSQSKAGLETLKTARENERKNLNTLLRQPLSLEITVEYSSEPEELPEDIEKYVADKLANDLGIKLKELNAQIKKMVYDLALATADNKREIYNRSNKNYQDSQDRIDDVKELREETPGYEEEPDDNQPFLTLNQQRWESEQAGYERDDAKLAMDEAAKELEDARSDMESAIYSQFNALNQLALKEQTLLTDLENAEEQLQLLAVRVETGMATQFDLDSAEYGILKLETDLSKNKNAEWLQQFLFLNPVLSLSVNLKGE